MRANTLKTTTLAALLGAAACAALAAPARADDMKKVMDKPATEKCYGVAKAGKNDCAAGDHSCAGQSTRDYDKASFVALPAGACAKLAGGSLAAMAK
jgi:uncharacterized membrane protein